MKYFSTRGGRERLSFEETVLTGLAPDGGLYIPEHIPLSLRAGKQNGKTTPSSTSELRALAEKSYSTFRHPQITPLKKLGEKTYVLELFHGPTFAFKDVALQLLGNLFEFFLLRRNARKAAGEKPERLTVVGATSGDTGSAAIYGLRNKADISIFILHPKGRVSPIQEAQMTTVTDANVHNLAVNGTFDDCQDIVKALFADRAFNAAHRLGAVNSINWARILAQTVYYFLSYFQLRAQLGGAADATRMGLPMDRLVVATNANDILARFWKSGAYEKVDSTDVGDAGVVAPAHGASDGKQTSVGGVKETLSPAMDILVSSNFERLLWYLAYEGAAGEPHGASKVEEAGSIVDGWMKKVKSDGRVQVPIAVVELARRDFLAERISDQQTLETIRYYFESEPSYVADPHTAVGLCAARIIATHNAPSTVQIVLSTAHPAKFSEAVTRALESSAHFNFERDVLPDEFKGLLDRERRVIDVEAPEVELVKKVIERFAESEQAAGGAGSV
ncbi:Threonine synthase [Grifola frondosa]|uniref:threonine synthase n=1 Tax=Grifola frondosa TaxID=5627 RepID=A0A1C7MIF7_GRIFR|nr:Threonine synthase [Grifola frondosa]